MWHVEVCFRFRKIPNIKLWVQDLHSFKGHFRISSPGGEKIVIIEGNFAFQNSNFNLKHWANGWKWPTLTIRRKVGKVGGGGGGGEVGRFLIRILLGSEIFQFLVRGVGEYFRIVRGKVLLASVTAQKQIEWRRHSLTPFWDEFIYLFYRFLATLERILPLVWRSRIICC